MSESMTIGEAAARSGVPPKTIRFYEDAGIIKPPVRRANRIALTARATSRRCVSFTAPAPWVFR